MKKLKNTQPLRRELEKVLDRTICDDTWHKLRKKLLSNGIEYTEFPVAFQLLKQLHAGKTGNCYRLIPPNNVLIDCWNQQKKVNKANSSHKMKCSDYLHRLIKNAKQNKEALPKDRFNKKGKRIGFNTIWYRWFASCGIPFEMDKEYTIHELMCVNYHLKLWQIKQTKRLTDSIFDAEVV